MANSWGETINGISINSEWLSEPGEKLLVIKLDLNESGLNDEEIEGFFEFSPESGSDEYIAMEYDDRLNSRNTPYSRTLDFIYRVPSFEKSGIKDFKETVINEFKERATYYPILMADLKEVENKWENENKIPFYYNGKRYYTTPVKSNNLKIWDDEMELIKWTSGEITLSALKAYLERFYTVSAPESEAIKREMEASNEKARRRATGE